MRESTDRAVFLNDGATHIGLGIAGYGGIAVFPVLCLTHPDYVTELHPIITEATLQKLRNVLPEIGPYIDVIMLVADDWGTQNYPYGLAQSFPRTVFTLLPVCQ